MNQLLNKVPPQSIDAERAVIGSILKDGREQGTDNQAMVTVLPIVKPHEFHRTAHSKIFAAMVKLFNQSQPIDNITVGKCLKDAGMSLDLELLDCSESVVSSVNAQEYAEIVHEMYLARDIITETHNLAESVFNGIHPKEILAKMSSYALKQSIQNSSELSWHEILLQTNDIIGTDEVFGIPLYLEKLNDAMMGLKKGNLTVIAARPSHGKSAFTLAQLLYAAKLGYPVGLISLEMAEKQLAIRALSNEMKVNSKRLKAGNLTDQERGRLADSYNILDKLPLHIRKMSVCSVADVYSIARTWKQQHDIQILAIDYLQLMTHTGETKNDAIGNTTRQLKNLAGELDMNTIALSQLSRENEKHNRLPQLSDLRDSGAIEQDADDVVFIHNPNFDDENDFSIATFRLAKQREGETGIFDFIFKKQWAGFENMVDEQSS